MPTKKSRCPVCKSDEFPFCGCTTADYVVHVSKLLAENARLKKRIKTLKKSLDKIGTIG